MGLVISENFDCANYSKLFEWTFKKKKKNLVLVNQFCVLGLVLLQKVWCFILD